MRAIYIGESVPDDSVAAASNVGWENDDLALTAERFATAGSDEGIDEVVRFFRGVVKVLRRRRSHSEANTDPLVPAIFLLGSPSSEFRTQSRRIPMLDSGIHTLHGRIWVVSAPVVAGRCLDVSTDDDGELFDLAAEYGMGAFPAVVHDPRAVVDEVRFYPSGLDNEDDREVMGLADETITVDEIYKVIQRVYAQSLVTPGAGAAGGSLWKDAGKHWVSRDAERQVQSHLHAGLAGAFRTCIVRPEQPMPEGRCDLEIERERGDGAWERLAMLELKVLRTFGATGKRHTDDINGEHVRKGVVQAYAYARSKGFGLTMLCCFDMQIEDTGTSCFEAVQEEAARLKVDLRRWYLYASAARWREALAAQG